MKGDFTQATINTLRKRAGEMCSICKGLTTIPHSNPEKSISLGEAAHIRGKKKAPNNRYCSNISSTQISNILNGIWLCRDCHKKVDSDEVHYTVEFLLETKKQHESDLSLGKLNYKKFKEYQKLEYEVFYLKKELEDSEEQNLQLISEIAKIENEKLQFQEVINDIEQTLSNPEQFLMGAHKCFFEQKDLDGTLKLINETTLVKEEKLLAKKRLLIAQVKEAQGNLEETEANFKKSIEIHPYLENLFHYGKFLFNTLQYTKCLKIYKRIVGPNNDESVKKRRLDYKTVHILNRTCLILSQVFQQLNDLESALQYVDNAINFQRFLIDKNPAEINYHINTLSIQGNILCNLERYDQALIFHNQALELTELKFQSNSYEVASCHGNLGIDYFRLNDQINAKIHLVKALIILEGKQSIDERGKGLLAKMYSWLGRISTNKDFVKKAFILYSELSEKNTSKYFRDKIVCQVDYAGTIDRFSEREKLYQNIVGQEKILIETDFNIYEPLLANVYRLFAIDLKNNKQVEKALAISSKAISLLKTLIERDENYIKDLIIALNLRIDLLLFDKDLHFHNLVEDVEFFERLMSDRKFKNKDFKNVFDARLQYFKREVSI